MDDLTGPAGRGVGIGAGDVERVAGVPARGRGAVAASILGAFLIGAYVAASPGGLRAFTGAFLLSAAVLALAFWFPAMRIASLAAVGRQWKGLVVWIVAWTLVWDLATSGILLRRAFFQEWWIVYPAGFLTLAGMLALHGAVMGWTTRRGQRAGPGRPPEAGAPGAPGAGH